ncbi:glycosyltransferase family 2 protein [Colwellia echini]|uniref:Glycosyltransferase family 2 protein n=1 Tax=Colwellia echini TaxID=1982103 RepID=A0ABY3MVT9_9GAMM|nr:glycosyltransferase family 2 protein [Colwellia echini]TYK65327.1 glycosyltransferase family 2 protein [Colwellia echini]
MFSIVIPTYKNYPDLLMAVESCSHPLIKEIIIVDDTPSEEQGEIKLPDSDAAITIVRNTRNRGVTFSRNRGYFMSSQPYIIFLDSDDTLIKSNLLLAVDYLEKNNIDCAFFNTCTNGRENSTIEHSVEGNWAQLFKMANSGERLLVIRKIIGKPFIGKLRGHELAGLFFFTLKNNSKLGWSPILLREYNQSNEFSLSQMRLSKERSHLISLGHFKVAKRLFSLCKIKLSSIYFLKACYYAISSRISR